MTEDYTSCIVGSSQTTYSLVINALGANYKMTFLGADGESLNGTTTASLTPEGWHKITATLAGTSAVECKVNFYVDASKSTAMLTFSRICTPGILIIFDICYLN